MSQLAVSVEFVELFMDSSSSEVTASVELTKGQDISNCVPFVSWYCGNEYFDEQFSDIWFTDTGTPTINAERADYGTSDIYIKAYVVEFDPEKVKVYQGDIPSPVTYNVETPVTITSGTFDQSRTAMVFYHKAAGAPNADYLSQHTIRGRVNSDGTTLSFIKELSSSATHTGHYYAFESIDEDFMVEHYTGSFSTAFAYEIGVYDWHNTFILSSYCSSYNGTGPTYQTAAAYLWGGSNAGYQRYNTIGTIFYNAQIIHFDNDATASGVRYCPKIKTEYIGSSEYYLDIDVAEGIQATDTLSVVVGQNVNTSTGNGGASKSCIFSAIWLTSSGTQYRIERANYTYPSTLTYAIVDWNGQQPLYTDVGTNPSPIPSGTSPVKSVENLSISFEDYIGVGHLSKGQDPTNCIAFRTGYSDKVSFYNRQNDNESFVYIRGNEVFVERGGFDSTYYAEVSVVEFYPEQVRVQSGDFSIGMNETSTTVTLDTAIDTSKTFLTFGYYFPSTEDAWGYHQCRGWVATSGTLGFDRGLSHTYPITGKWFLAEALAGAWDVYHDESTYGTSQVYTFLDEIHASRYNTFTLFSTKTNTNSTAPNYATWNGSYNSPMSPIVTNRLSTTSNNQVSAQVVVFSNNVRIRTWPIHFYFTGTEAEISYSAHTTMSGTYLTPIHASIGMQSAVSTTSSTYSTLLFTKVATNYESNQVTFSRNNNSNYSYVTEGVIFAVSWGGIAVSGSDTEINGAGYFVKSIDPYSFTGEASYIPSTYLDGQDLNNCIPLFSYSAGEVSSSELDRMIYAAWQYPGLKTVHFEVANAPNDPGVDLAAYLLEFDPEQIKVQMGYSWLFSGTSTTTATIEEVDTTKAFLIHHTYISDSIGTNFGPGSVAGKINTPTQLDFERGVNTCDVMIAWYVVECLQDQWAVSTYEINNQNTTLYTYTLATPTVTDRTVSWVSYSQEQTSFVPSYCMFNTYTDSGGLGVTAVYAERAAASSEVERMNFSVIEFNEDAGVTVEQVDFHFVGTSNSVEVTLSRDFDVNRSVIWYGQSWPVGKVSTTNSTYTKRGFFKAVVQDSRTVLITRESTSGFSIDAYGHLYVVEFTLPSHEISGVVTEEGEFVSRQLYFHKTADGECLGGTTSSGDDGSYHFYTTYSGSTYAVCLDDEAGTAYNGLIVTDVYPGPIENAWSTIKGW